MLVWFRDSQKLNDHILPLLFAQDGFQVIAAFGDILYKPAIAFPAKGTDNFPDECFDRLKLIFGIRRSDSSLYPIVTMTCTVLPSGAGGRMLLSNDWPLAINVFTPFST